MDVGKVTALTLLDLSSSLETIDHTILLSRLDDWFGVTGKAVAWFKSYLTGRCQRIRLGDWLFVRQSWSEIWSPSRVSFRSSAFHTLRYSSEQHDLWTSYPSPSLLTTTSCMFSLHRGTLLRHWMVYSHVWPLSSQGCWWIKWNWTQINLNFSLSGTNDSGANTSLYHWAFWCQN